MPLSGEMSFSTGALLELVLNAEGHDKQKYAMVGTFKCLTVRRCLSVLVSLIEC